MPELVLKGSRWAVEAMLVLLALPSRRAPWRWLRSAEGGKKGRKINIREEDARTGIEDKADAKVRGLTTDDGLMVRNDIFLDLLHCAELGHTTTMKSPE